MKNYIDISKLKKKEIHTLGEDFFGSSPDGNTISFTNYYMEKNGKPFFGVSGEFHFSRMDESYWEDEIAKMKMGGINVIATYVFWNHHEEEEGVFDFSGRKNVRKFVELCVKYGIYVILRVGPFDHGEVRNGGFPDWLYGKPFEVRQLNEGFLYYTRRLYEKIAEQMKGMFFQDGGMVIGVQIDNEYMHSSAPWEITTGISNEWVFGGNEGDTYMLALKKLAAECGLNPVVYTCTGWGGAATPDCMLPLWGGYAFQPWLFYSYSGEHPATKEYVYQDFHNNDRPASYNFKPRYAPEDKPYACCEMGGGMMCSYYYRFKLPYKSVDAMANIKMASGCNFLGYYVYQGGSNPVGKHGTFMNEGQVPKISYDYQACLGEFGQVRESYRRLKTLHFFTNTYGDRLCGLKTVLPEGASEVEPEDTKTLRYAVRTDGRRGFLFLNNYQDHANLHEKRDETVELQLEKESIVFERIGLAAEENCILPFHFDMDGIDLRTATAQVVTNLEIAGTDTYIFMRPEGMSSYFEFEEGVLINGKSERFYQTDDTKEFETFCVEKNGKTKKILCISRAMSDRLYIPNQEGLVFAEEAVFVRDKEVLLESSRSDVRICTYPENLFDDSIYMTKLPDNESLPELGMYEVKTDEKMIAPVMKQVAENRYTIEFPKAFMKGTKDVLLQIHYRGDIGHAFINGQMIHDNFCNNDVWEIGLRAFAEQLEEAPLTIYITPLKKGAKVNVESAMAARMEEVESMIGEIDSIEMKPVYEMKIR